MRTQLEEYQTQIQTLQSSYLRKMEIMEVAISFMYFINPCFSFSTTVRLFLVPDWRIGHSEKIAHWITSDGRRKFATT